jgi:ribose transport system substrate-binding protein
MPPRPPARPAAFARAATLALAATAAAGGAACARKDSGQYTVGFAQMESNNPWRLAQTASLKAEAAKRGYQLVVTDAQGQTSKQVSDVEDLIARRVKVILLAPREYQGLVPALQAAKQAKIPVILVDREAAGTPGQDYVTFLGSNFVEQGKRAADWLAKSSNGAATVVELTGTPGSSVATDRAKGFRDEIAKYPGMKVVASQTGDFSRAKGQQVMQNLAQSLGKGFTAVYAHNDEMALGAIEALKAAGRRPGRTCSWCRWTASARRSRPSSAASWAPRSRATRASGRSRSRRSRRCGAARRCRRSSSSPTASSTRATRRSSSARRTERTTGAGARAAPGSSRAGRATHSAGRRGRSAGTAPGPQHTPRSQTQQVPRSARDDTSSPTRPRAA